MGLPENGNGLTTMAVLSTKMDMILEKLDDQIMRADKRDDRLRCCEDKMTRIEERQSNQSRNQAIFSAIYSTIAAAVAGFIGGGRS